MSRRKGSGNAKAGMTENHTPPTVSNNLDLALPDPVRLDMPESVEVTVPEGVTYTAFGLRPTSLGYEVIRVTLNGDEVERVERLREPEPQRAIAQAYLEGAVFDEFLKSRLR